MTTFPQMSGWRNCPVCDGTGHSFEERPCARCGGSGKVSAALYNAMMRGDGFTPAFRSEPARILTLTQQHCVDCGAPYIMPPQAALLPEQYLAGFRRCEACQQVWADKADAEDVAQRRADWQDKLTRWWANCGVPPRYRDASFATFQRDANGEEVAGAYDVAREWADAWDWRAPDAMPGLVLFATSKGTGKTHLLTAAVRRLLERCVPSEDALLALVRERSQSSGGPAACPVRFWQANDLLLRIAQARRPVVFGQDGPPRETEEDVYRSLAQVRLLALDDLGQAPTGKMDIEQAHVWEKVVNDRYNASLPIVATTNLSMAGGAREFRQVVGERAASRLQEMADFVRCEGQDFRPRRRS